MAILRILTYPDPRLKTVATVVEDIRDPEVQKMIDDMLETLENTPQCGGLAATQLDIKHPKRIFVFYDFDEEKNTPGVATAVINPEIVGTVGEVYESEGCMSVYPHSIHAAITRPAETHMRGINRHGNPVEYTRRGYLAKNFLHEVDHLNGKLYIDHLKPLKRSMIDKKIHKIQRVITDERG